jgi:hypothetical protein
LVVQVVEQLPSKNEALSSSFSITKNTSNLKIYRWTWWYVPVMQHKEEDLDSGQPWGKQELLFKITKAIREQGVAQEVQPLPGKHEVQGSNPSTTEKNFQVWSNAECALRLDT